LMSLTSKVVTLMDLTLQDGGPRIKPGRQPLQGATMVAGEVPARMEATELGA
jgi:hypothetical protein